MIIIVHQQTNKGPTVKKIKSESKLIYPFVTQTYKNRSTNSKSCTNWKQKSACPTCTSNTG